MEIRLLYGNELQMAVNTAYEVFEMCDRPRIRSQAEAEQFYRYVQVENLWQEMSAGRLFLWGVFDGGQMCAVSAMQNVGHITMLYVKLYYARRHMGAQLVNHMCAYAAQVLHRERVTVNVMPVAFAPYFYHIGFTLMQSSPLMDNYVSLERRIWAMQQNYVGAGPVGGRQYGQMPPPAAYPLPGMPTAAAKRPEITYPTKKVSKKLIIALTAGVLAFSFAVIGGVTIYHMAEDGSPMGTWEWETPKDEHEADDQVPEGLGEPQEL